MGVDVAGAGPNSQREKGRGRSQRILYKKYNLVWLGLVWLVTGTRLRLCGGGWWVVLPMSSGWLILQVVETVTVQPRDNHDTLSVSNAFSWTYLER